jgi:spore germination cell wall hydrolase CwlJ-like protein
MYHEARGTEIDEQFDNAKLVFNRIKEEKGAFPKTIEGVVSEKRLKDGVMRCQFTWVCEKLNPYPEEKNAWLLALMQAHTAYRNMSEYGYIGISKNEIDNNVLFYYDKSIINNPPSWSRKMKKVKITKNFIFLAKSS